MKRGKEFTEVVLDIRKDIPGFNRNELLQYAKWAIPELYNSLRNEKQLDLKYKPELIDKLNKEREKYRINKNIDHISVQYVELFDTIRKDGELYIQVYASIYFYDNVDNNVEKNFLRDKYWNDIWIVTFKESIKTAKKSSNCANCGAIMKYNHIKDMFKCEYCGNIIDNNNNSNWQMIDIELEN